MYGKQANFSTLNINGNLLAYTDQYNSTILNLQSFPTNYINTNVIHISTINNTVGDLPLMTFDYVNNRVGINLLGTQPQAALEVNGTVVCETFLMYSDPRLKEFKSNLEISAEELDKLRPMNFTWKANGREDIGFSADDIENISPLLIRKGPNGLKMVDYSKLSVVAISALQQTNLRLAALESSMKLLFED
jgi:hypothetical protein